MRKTLKVLAIITALMTVLAITAFAADFEHCADVMNELGLFKGTQNGYELDRAPTRAEAATMLVRLLGAEEEASALTYTAPYTDVADWAKPYVQYLHNNGLTNGTSADTFGYSDKCTAQQYATFLLRALGYSDSEDGDFTYVEAMSFAKEKGIVDSVNCDEESFLRDHVAAMSFTALATAPKSGEADLLSKLVAEGAVADAKGYDVMFANYRAYASVTGEFDSADKVSMDMTVDAVLSADGSETVNISQSYEITAEFNRENADLNKMSYCGTISGNGKTISANYYYTDGYVYMDIGGSKTKAAMPFEGAKEEIGAVTMQDDADPISNMKNVTSETAADGTVTYTAEYAYALLNKGIADNGVELKAMTASASAKDGSLTGMSFTTEATQMQNGTAVDMTVTTTASNLKYGDSITVTLPTDLDSYVE